MSTFRKTTTRTRVIPIRTPVRPGVTRTVPVRVTVKVTRTIRRR